MKVCLVAILWLSLSVHTARCEEKGSEKPSEKPANVKIKIVDSPASRIAPFQLAGTKELTLRIKPSNLSGPSHLQQLAGECFMLKEQGYEYRVCPFHNVTQKEERIGWNSFHGVLGVWREWLIENDTFIGMHFVSGQECSVGDREVKVLFNCSTMTRLHGTSEPSTCHYVIWLDTPLACFKGAMQVYHLLTPEQLKQWEQYEYEYHADELTFQGLTKRRRKILTEAGLLFDHETERARLEREKREREEEEEERERERRREEQADNPLFKSPLSACEKERDQLRKDLDELMGKIRGVIKDFPSVAYRLGFIQNFTASQRQNGEPQAPVKEEEEQVAVDDNGGVGDEGVAAVIVDGGKKREDGERRENGERREGERGEEGDREEVEQKEWSRGGFMDHDEVDEGQLDNILKEINEEVEERDMMELKQELSELQQPGQGGDSKLGNQQNGEQQTEDGEEGGRKIDTDEQLLELVEQLKQAHA